MMFVENLRCVSRNLRASPGFTLTAVLSLGIGIGGTVSMFTLVKSILLKPLAYRDPDKLVLITQAHANLPSYLPTFGLAPIEFLRWRNEIRSFESLSIVTGATANLTGAGTPQTLGAVRISAEFFDTLRVKPQLGRWFRRDEEKRGMPGVAIISASLWRQRFSSDPNIIGKSLTLDGARLTRLSPSRLPTCAFFEDNSCMWSSDFPNGPTSFYRSALAYWRSKDDHESHISVLDA
jgi:hypothetical protein